ncbi:SUMF1/EgtB/PvdO family nonheme iron enzyme [Micromonospora chalcea]
MAVEEDLRHALGSLTATHGLLAWDLPTFIEIGCTVRSGSLETWRLTFNPKSRRMSRNGYTRPILNAARLQALVDTGRLDHVVAVLEKETIGQASSSEFRPSFESGHCMRPPWLDGIKDQVVSLHVKDLVATGEPLLIIGQMGSGKSTFVRLVIRELLRQPEQVRTGSVALINLRRAAPHLAMAASLRGSLGLADLLKTAVAAPDAPELSALLEEWIVGGTLILDGYDELSIALPRNAARQTGDAVIELLHALADTGVQVLLTTRPDVVPTANADWLLPVHLAPLLLTEALSVAKIQQPTLREVASLNLVFEALPEEFSSTPLFASIVAGLIASGRLPSVTSRSELLQASLRDLLERRVLAKGNVASLQAYIRCDYETLLTGLALLSYEALFAAGSSGSDISSPSGLSRGRVMEFFFGLDETIDVSRLASVLTRDSGLMRSEGAQLYFVHRIFQEALAAIAIERAPDESAAGGQLLEALVAHPSAAREVGMLYADAAAGKGRISELMDLCDIALSRVEALGLAPSTAHLVWYAARLLSLVRPRRQRTLRRDAAVVESFRSLAASTMIRRDLLSVRDRSTIASELSFWGDDRSGVGVNRAGYPDILWCPVPSGVYCIGLTPEQAEQVRAAGGFQVQREIPSLLLSMPLFSIARYPVTWCQFRSFLNDPDGFGSPRWWPSDAEPSATTSSDRATRRAELLAFVGPGNLPVTGVSWYEANAFARWLASVTAEPVDLPSEEEWEAAARGKAGYLYPWGAEFDPGALNWEGAGVGHVVPVGLFQRDGKVVGEGPCDMLGNTWEWTKSIAGPVRSSHFAPIGEAPTAGFQGEELRRIVRGGCYLNGVALLRATYRGNDAATSRFDRQGFRLVKRG